MQQQAFLLPFVMHLREEMKGHGSGLGDQSHTRQGQLLRESCLAAAEVSLLPVSADAILETAAAAATVPVASKQETSTQSC